MFVTFTLIHLVTILILYSAMWATYRPQARYRNGMLFAVTLPAHAMEHPALVNIQSRFKRQFMQVSLWMGAAVIPLVAMNAWKDYEGFSFIYFFLWLAVFLFVIVVPFRRAFRATLALKREQEWFVGKKNVVHSDLRVARLKNAKSAPIGLFVIPLAMSVGTLLWAMSEDETYAGIAYVGILTTFVFLLVSFYMRRTKAKVYSENSDINLSLNQARRRSLSYMWLMVAIVENLHFPLVYLFIQEDNASLAGVWLAAAVLFSAIPVVILILTYRRIHAREQEVLSQDGQAIYSDDDEYWANGFTYHNPYDRAVFVPKRVGIGETVNTATLTGKMIAWGSIGLVAATIIVVSFLLIRSELTSPTLTLTADRQVEIDYPMYNYDFSLADIEQLDLVDQVPKGFKTNGESKSNVARGKFSLNGLGATRLYIYKNNPPYIRMKLKSTYIFYNDQDPERTKQLYAQLRNSMQP